MRKYETLDLEFEQDTLDLLNKTAKEQNMTLDELVNEILEDYISKKVSISEYTKILTGNGKKVLKEFYTIIDNNGKPIARVRPIGFDKEKNNED